MPKGQFPHTREFCECGAAIHIAGPYKAEIMKTWAMLHSGPGHQERVTAPEAEKIRAVLRKEGRLASGKKR